VVAFLFADLIVLPILDIYRKYYGLKVAAFLLVTFYAAMAGAALLVELLFGLLHLIPQQRNAQVLEEAIHWNYTSVLNLLFFVLAALLLVRFFRTGGPAMLRMMSSSASERREHSHAHHTRSGSKHSHNHEL
jgi:uncharacterized membrane protein YraQ (UPF0718 family)